MKNLIRIFVLAAAVMALVGCVQTDIVVQLNADGSGTVTETVMMSKAVTAQMKSTMESMQKGMGGEGGEEAGPVELWKEEEIRAQADNMGEGVKFESMEMVDTEGFEGYRAKFSFTDINKLMVNQNPGSSVPEQEGEEVKSVTENIMFSYDKGSPSTLTIRQPEEPKDKAKGNPEAEAEKPEVDPAQQEMMMSMMKMMIEGMRIAISVEVPGEVVSTNATYQEGSRITLMEMDFDKLLASEEHWKAFAEQNPETVEDTKELMKSVPGIKVEQEREVTVKFK